MKSKITIQCLCGRVIVLEVVGGQYQNIYQGECKCGRKWSLEEQSEVLMELYEQR